MKPWAQFRDSFFDLFDRRSACQNDPPFGVSWMPLATVGALYPNMQL